MGYDDPNANPMDIENCVLCCDPKGFIASTVPIDVMQPLIEILTEDTIKCGESIMKPQVLDSQWHQLMSWKAPHRVDESNVEGTVTRSRGCGDGGEWRQTEMMEDGV